MKSVALKESILRSLGRGQERMLAEVHSYVTNDYGEVSTRSVLRYLDMLVAEGKVMRSGVHGHRIYAQVKVNHAVSGNRRQAEVSRPG